MISDEEENESPSPSKRRPGRSKATVAKQAKTAGRRGQPRRAAVDEGDDEPGVSSEEGAMSPESGAAEEEEEQQPRLPRARARAAKSSSAAGRNGRRTKAGSVPVRGKAGQGRARSKERHALLGHDDEQLTPTDADLLALHRELSNE